MTEPQERTTSLLASIWLRQRPLLEERLAMLDHAACSASAGTLADDVRLRAVDTAHKLAGSLGMYGYDDGTRIARRLEELFDQPAPVAEHLQSLTAELRRSVFPPMSS